MSIDNEIVGEPDIECLEEEIRIWVKTKKPFAGRIYAKGKADVSDCSRDDFARERTKKPHFDLKFGVCGMKSLRSLFITKVDQAFHVKCFFEEASRGLTAELGVSMIPTNEVEARHGIPGCSYSIHRSSIQDLDEGKPAGPPIQFARVGDRVLHQWHCNDQMFGVLINNCYVTDGFGKKADVIDDKGCAVDPILITGIRYSPDLQRAYAESSVFKFADKPGVWFFCRIQMCMKKSGMCNGITPPSCATTASTVEERQDGYQIESLLPPPPPPPPPSPEEFEYEEAAATQQRTTTSYDYFNSKQQITTAEYLEYPDENKDLKLHSPISTSSYSITHSPDYDQQLIDVATVVAPGYVASNRVRNEFKGAKISTDSVSQLYETDDHLQSQTSSKKSTHIEKNDYNEYDDVTIPPNLTELLANLPDDLSPEALQKMLRDSVVDRKSILEDFELLKKQLKKFNRRPPRTMRNVISADHRLGEKIDQIEVDWMSTRRRDTPLLPKVDVSSHVSKNGDDLMNNDKPMISGQLMIFELDEEPPEATKHEETSNSDHSLSFSTCAISRRGLFAVVGSLGAAFAALLVAVLTMYFKLNRIDGGRIDNEVNKTGYWNGFATFEIPNASSKTNRVRSRP
ncbi:zona pellucida-like domain protein [Dictyocaulus viviparus]|uniref:Zona pellucida-like domain protein n=1 Tax=Dictyocaulus viviparus TaxID=29172 RepID=A0A0D8YAJ4_DICVI|nr:zona pellucida-like domain protein [Dictyocaulus viviparus]